MSEASNDGEHAKEYDELAKKYLWFGNEAVFGLCYEFLTPGQTLLDLGIGTGLGSQLFHNAGLEVYGLDISQEMLDICEKKNIAKELLHHDLGKTPFPYDDNRFSFVISIGVLHFFKDLDNIFSETRRLLKENGTFAFSIADNEDESKDFIEKVDESWGAKFICHSRPYIEKLIERHGFQKLKELTFFGYDGDMKPMRMVAYILS